MKLPRKFIKKMIKDLENGERGFVNINDFCLDSEYGIWIGEESFVSPYLSWHEIMPLRKENDNLYLSISRLSESDAQLQVEVIEESHLPVELED